MKVKNKQDEDLGKVSDLVVDFKSGKIAYAVLSSGGSGSEPLCPQLKTWQ